MKTQNLRVLLLAVCTIVWLFGNQLCAQTIFASKLGTSSVWEIGPTGNVITTGFGMMMNTPRGLALRNGHLFVAYGQAETKVAEFDLNGSLINPLFASGLTTSPGAMDFDPNGNLCVIHAYEIAKFGPTGNLLNPQLITGPGYTSPGDLVFDRLGNMYVSYPNMNLIAKYDPMGQLINGSYITGLNNPRGLAFDDNGNLYVANFFGLTVSKYNANGALLNGAYITGLSYLPDSLAFDGSGNLFVGSNGNGTISKYDPNGNVISAIFSSGSSGLVAMLVVPEPASGSLALIGLTMAVIVLRKRSL